MKIDFTKKGVDGVNVYSRLHGTVGWTKLGYDSNAPYFDTAPLQAPNIPEVREYKARGVLADVEIGVDSDIVTATFAG